MKGYICLALALCLSGIAFERLGRQLSARHARVNLPVTSQAGLGDPDIWVQGVRLVEQAETGTVLTVSAEAASWYDAAQSASVSQVRAQLFPSDTAPLSVEANRAQIVSTTGDMAMQGHVRLWHQAGYTLTTDALYWQAASRTLHTDKPVSMQSATVSISGMGLQSDMEQQRFVIQHDVRASFQLR
jgi:LPS export ABC transporter protein LptC